jgi:hypothetical protein
MAGRRRQLAEALAAARQRSRSFDLIAYAEAYCDAQGCVVREVLVRIKEDIGETPPTTWRCPTCRHPLKLHHVLTLEEHAHEQRREARCSLNAELWRRRNPGAPGVPVSVLLDDSLPDVV